MDLIALKAIVKMLLLPPAGLLGLALLGLALIRRRPRTGRALAVAGVVACWVVSMPVLSLRLFMHLEAGQRALDADTWRAAKDGPDPPRAVVILGNGARRDGVVEPYAERLLAASLERTVAGARIARLTGLPALVSGARLSNMKLSEAELMRQVLEGEWGVPVRWANEKQPIGHAEIGRDVAEALRADGITSVVLAVPAHNMHRARAALEAAGLRVLPAPHTFRGAPVSATLKDWVPSASGLDGSFVAFYELFGAWSYRLPGRALEPEHLK